MIQTSDSMDALEPFSLLGGPLHRIGCRLGLVRGGTDTLGLGVALALLAWGILILLALLCGVGARVFSLSVIGGHVRLLVAIPLFFLCETWVVPRMAEFVREIVQSGLVPDTALPALAGDVRRVGRLKDSWLAEVVFLLLAVCLPLAEKYTQLSGATGSWSVLLVRSGQGLTWVSGWYLAFCLPLYRLLVLRWLWRLGLWSWFLWRLRRLGLRLVPTHPDGAAGLGFLEVVHEQFVPLVAGISAVCSAGLAGEIAAGAVAFQMLYRLAPFILAVMAALFIGPLCVFTPALWRCRVTGWSDYMAMASRYVAAFDRRWVQDGKATGEAQLGTPDLQSLADLANSVDKVRNVRWIPAGRRLLTGLAAAALAPLSPLLLFEYPAADLLKRLLSALTGL